ncbi:phiSA1p31-related protein [Streptomyces sp. NPDC006326]|uniref:phiSA1p31-related protein n=1 Tax=Streptomyces sp. NPDC006326 TaxID=3156752 RepID=UPI0033B7B542
MATAEYETTTRTVEETLVVLKLTEDEADELCEIVGAADGTRRAVAILQALQRPEAPKPSTTYTYRGETYDMGATYLDDSGDPWIFGLNSAGEPRALNGSWSVGRSLQYAVDEYGPMRKSAN